MDNGKNDSGRFMIDGNRLIVTSLFDPRYQRGAEGELLNTIDGLLEDQPDGSVVLDLHNRENLPSMLVGIIVEAHRRVSSQGRMLSVLVRPDHIKSLQWVGLQRIFEEKGTKTDGDGLTYLELTSKTTE
ncbi:MAG: hypothetical protein JXR97_04210 [Planctomycetes bacterium]|nr:hypothetical protein [Planctomycetota bacterium]